MTLTKAAKTLLLVTLLVAAPPGAARADNGTSLSWQTHSLMRGFVRPAGAGRAQYMPFYQLVDLHARDLGVQGLSLHTSFWGMVDILDIQEEERGTGDLNTLYLTFSPRQDGPLGVLHGMEITVGRQMVAMGATLLEQVDGARLRYLHGSGFEVGAFGGLISGIRLLDQGWPDTVDQYDNGPDSVVGARAGYVNLGFLSGGVSFAHRWFDGEAADMDLSADLSVTPISLLEISGLATLSLMEMRLKEARASVALYPVRPLSIIAGFHFTSPDLWIPRTSIFSVFSNETHMEASLRARWQVTRKISLDAAYGRLFYDAKLESEYDEDSDGANRASLSGAWRFNVKGVSGGVATLDLDRVESPENAANRARLASRVPLCLWGRTFKLVADLELTVLDELMRDSRLALRGAAYLVVPVTDTISVLAGGRGGFSPLFTREGAFTVRLTWTGLKEFSRGGAAPRSAL